MRWTVRKLCELIGCVRGALPGRETVRRVLKELGLSWKKARKLLGRACPLRRAEFVQTLRDLMQQSTQPDGPLLLFGDEAHLHTDTDLGYSWAPRGQRLFVHSHSPPLGQKCTVFGTYALMDPEPVRLFCAAWANSQTTCTMLEQLRAAYPKRPLILVWDNVSYHRSKTVRDCAQQLGIQLVYLPPYSPDFMPVERLWAWLREELTALHCHKDVEQLTARIGWFEQDRNGAPSAVHQRLRPKLHLDPAEEKLRG